MRRIGYLLVAFVSTAVLVAASAFGANHGHNTAQGQIVDARSWRFERSFLVGSCRNGYLPPQRCAVVGRIDFVLTATLSGDRLSLTQRFSSRDGIRFRIEPAVVCRIERIFDTDCAGATDPEYMEGFGAEADLRASFQDAEAGVRKFVNLIYQVEVEDVGTLRGSAKTNESVFLGTTQRWTCRRNRSATAECRFG
ncbi:hypothetical protein ACWEOZ_36105 [Actinoplanes sp. NPDC004185]